MSTFTLTIVLGSSTMSTPEDVGRTLNAVAAKLADGNKEGTIRDDNGNNRGGFGADDWPSDDASDDDPEDDERGFQPHYGLAELRALPTLDQSMFADLKVDEDNKRAWLSRMTAADGAPYENQVSIEREINGVWTTVAQYQATDD
jgi:hypothetical protein